MITVVRRHFLEALTQEGDVFGAPDETHVWTWMNEGSWVRDRALLDQKRPKLARQVEFSVDFERLRNVDAAILALWRLVQLAIGGMAGPGIIPAVRAFLGAIIERFEHGDAERRFELL
jgi:hypothetical protein